MIREHRRLSPDDFRSLCIKMDWFTRATTTQYEAAFRLCTLEMDTTNIQKLAEAVLRYSDLYAGDTLLSIMFSIARKCVTTFEEV